VTKARDLANIISGGFTVADLPTLTANEIPNLDAAKITSGTFADARLSQSSVQQYASTFDDNKIVNDISTLAIRQASNENKAAYNTNSMYVDVFQDSTGITNLTNVANVSEYLASVYTQVTNLTNGIAGGVQNGATLSNTTDYTGYDGVVRSGGKVEGSLTSSGGSYSAYNFNYIFPANTQFELIMYETGRYQGAGFFRGSSLNLSHLTYGNAYWDSVGTGHSYNSTSYPYTGQGVTYSGQYHAPVNGDGGSEYKNFYRFSRDANNSFKIQYYGRTTGTLNIDATNISNVRNSTNYVDNIGSAFTSGDQFILGLGEAGGGTTRISVEVANTTTASNNATGSFESNAITASSSTNKMGAIITYQDQAGTNALNTDIVLKLSADGGSNYSTATLTAMPDFASGIKMAKVNDLSVTAGTSLKYKLEFANQASGSKEARIRGVSLQY